MHLVAEIVMSCAASITKLVVIWVDGGRRSRWRRADTALNNLDIADGERWPVAISSAAVVPQPRGITTPVGDDEAHVFGDIVRHVVEVRAISSHALLSTVLGELSGEA